jgi:hypothetical protein
MLPRKYRAPKGIEIPGLAGGIYHVINQYRVVHRLCVAALVGWSWIDIRRRNAAPLAKLILAKN